MYREILPVKQHSVANRFLRQLPELIASSPLCQRLKPFSLFIDIAPWTLIAQPHSLIANELGLSPRVVLRRNNVIRQLLALHEPSLYQTILNLEKTVPKGVIRQAQAFKSWITDLLNTSVMPCAHCTSMNTVRIGHRLNFRCRSCRRTFNPLKAHHLNKLSHCHLWLPCIDLLMEGESCKTIHQKLGISVDTAAKWQLYFIWLMAHQGFAALANYCQVKRRQRYHQTWLEVKTDG